jgi:hypothetical protein
MGGRAQPRCAPTRGFRVAEKKRDWRQYASRAFGCVPSMFDS